MTNEPSPRPWRVDGIDISDANDEPVTPLYFNEQDEANAQLIVDAVNERERLLDIVRRAIPFVEGVVNAGALIKADDPDIVPFLTQEQKDAARKAYEEAVPLLAEARETIGEGKE